MLAWARGSIRWRRRVRPHHSFAVHLVHIRRSHIPSHTFHSFPDSVTLSQPSVFVDFPCQHGPSVSSFIPLEGQSFRSLFVISRLCSDWSGTNILPLISISRRIPLLQSRRLSASLLSNPSPDKAIGFCKCSMLKELQSGACLRFVEGPIECALFYCWAEQCPWTFRMRRLDLSVEVNGF